MSATRIATAAYLTLICIQFGVIIGFVVHSGRQIAEQDKTIDLWRIEAADWEQIANSYKRAASTYALSSEKCLQTVRYYQSSVFQPQEMAK